MCVKWVRNKHLADLGRSSSKVPFLLWQDWHTERITYLISLERPCLRAKAWEADGTCAFVQCLMYSIYGDQHIVFPYSVWLLINLLSHNMGAVHSLSKSVIHLPFTYVFNSTYTCWESLWKSYKCKRWCSGKYLIGSISNRSLLSNSSPSLH